MVAYTGALVELRIGDGASPIESFTAVGGLQVTSMQLRQQSTDINAIDSNGWQKRMAGGMRSLRISGEGVFTDSAAENALRSTAFAGALASYELEWRSGEKISGIFITAELQQRGAIGEVQTYQITLESAATITLN